MKDIFNSKILCNECNKETIKSKILKEGFTIRIATCPKCNEQYPHPTDLEEYKSFKKLRNKQFNVKLRLVGNSYAVSIPREIINFIEFENQIEKQFHRMVQLSLEEPKKLSLFFKRRIIR